jgi:hypothetical protein
MEAILDAQGLWQSVECLIGEVVDEKKEQDGSCSYLRCYTGRRIVAGCKEEDGGGDMGITEDTVPWRRESAEGTGSYLEK